MENRQLLSATTFRKLARVSRNTLNHYESLGLLLPISRDKNNYRRYSIGQLAFINVIRILQELGMTLSEIKTLTEQRSPERFSEILSGRISGIETKINEWESSLKLLNTFLNMIRESMDVDESIITVKYLHAEPIIIGDLNDYKNGHNDYDALLDFYKSMEAKYENIDLNYPVWGIVSEERLKRGKWRWTDRYYFYNPDGHDKRPAGLYAIGYARGSYGQTDELYTRMINYISLNGLEIAGDAYEEYPLNELCISDCNNYLIRIMISVREKQREYVSAKWRSLYRA